MGDQRQSDSIPGTLAALGFPLQRWILLFQFWREFLKRLLSLDAERSELQGRQGIPASPPMAAWVTKACTRVQSTSFFIPAAHLVEPPISWAGFTVRNTHTSLFSVTYPGTEEN